MEYSYIPFNQSITDEQADSIEEEAIARGRSASSAKAAGVLGGTWAGGDIARAGVKRSMVNALVDEFQDIRDNPELRAQNMRDMIQVYENFVNQTGNKVEKFIDKPGANFWAAGTTPDGVDVVYLDSTAPHPAVMAHELGHIDMNHSTDPMALLQRSGIGRLSGTYAPVIGIASGAIGHQVGSRMAGGSLRGRLLGTAAGSAVGAAGGSGNWLYEQFGASDRALDYLPESVDQQDAIGDLTRAGTTYAMAGPGAAAVSALLGGAGAAMLDGYLGRTRQGMLC